MNRAIVIAFIVLICSTAIFAESNFEPVEPTGLPYHIIVSNIAVNGAPVPAGAEIGIFDENLCVGSFTVESQGQTNLDIVAWQGNPGYGLAGFVVGHPITFKIWVQIYGEWQLLDAAATFSTGDGNFGSDSYSVAALAATSDDVPALSITPSILDFGNVTVGQNSSETFTISNTGSARLTINGISSNNSRFSLGTYPNYLDSGQSADVTVTFNPDAAVLTSATITISSDDPANLQKTISVSGQGIPMQQALIQVSPTSLNFGYVPLGTTVTQNVLIQNTGNQTLTLSNIYSSSSGFTPLPTVAAIDVGASYTLPVQFTPSGAGSISGTLTIISNAGNTPNLNIGLSGTGYTTHFTPVAETGLPYTIVINSAMVDGHNLQTGDQIAVFDGELCVGSVVYRGSLPLQLVAWRGDAGQSLPGFTVGQPMIFKVWATTYGQTVELAPAVSFIQGNGNFGDGEFSVITISANSGLQPVIDVDAEVLNFEPLQVGSQTTLTLSVENKGLSDLTVTNISSSNGAFWASPTNFTLAPNALRAITVTFQPQSAIPYATSLTIYSNDPDTPTLTVQMTGQGLTGTARNIQVSTTPIHFPPAKRGETSSASLTLFNSGSDVLTISSVQFSDAHFATSVSNFQIAVGASYNLPLTFSPDDVGLFSGNLTITNNSQNSPTITIALSGAGYEGYFQPVKVTGLPYTIIIDSLICTSLIEPQAGDEIGIFDDQLCVGIGIVENPSMTLSITCWQADNSQGLAGFTKGHPIKIRYFGRRDGGEHLFATNFTLIEGDGRFGTGAFSSMLDFLDHEIPNLVPPQNFTFANNIQNITLVWESYTTQNIAGFAVYRSNNPEFTLESISLLEELNSSAITYIDSNIVNDAIYYYAITAKDTINRVSEPVYLGPVQAVYIDVQDVAFAQRKDGSALVDVNFTFSGHDTTYYLVQPLVSIDNGNSWLELTRTSGEVGNVRPGVNRHFIWDFGQEMPDSYYKNVKVKVIVSTK